MILRKTLDISGKKIGLLPYGKKLNIDPTYSFPHTQEVIKSYTIENKIYPSFSLEGHWISVNSDGKTGFVYDRFLSKLTPLKLINNAVIYAVESIQEWASREFGLLKTSKLNNDTWGGDFTKNQSYIAME